MQSLKKSLRRIIFEKDLNFLMLSLWAKLHQFFSPSYSSCTKQGLCTKSLCIRKKIHAKFKKNPSRGSFLKMDLKFPTLTLLRKFINFFHQLIARVPNMDFAQKVFVLNRKFMQSLKQIVRRIIFENGLELFHANLKGETSSIFFTNLQLVYQIRTLHKKSLY